MSEISTETGTDLLVNNKIKLQPTIIEQVNLDIENIVNGPKDIKRREIFTSIAEHGLLPSRKTIENMKPLTSEDHLSSERTSVVSGTLIFSDKQNIETEKSKTYTNNVDGNPIYQDKLRLSYLGDNITIYLPIGQDNINKGILDISLYNDDSSVFPVVCEREYERKYETAEQSPRVLEERVQNSMLVVAEMDKIDSYTHKSNEIYLENLSPDKMVVLVPQYFFKEANSIFEPKGITVVSIPLVEEEIYKERKQNRVKVKLPDYETTLREIMKNSNSPLFIHGVRLPTTEDIKMLESTS